MSHDSGTESFSRGREDGIMSSMAPLIELTGVAKRYVLRGETVVALRDVNVRIEAGESVAVVGPSGSGKSTLLHVLSGLDAVDAGSVVVLGKALHLLDDDARSLVRNRSLGFVFQDFHLLSQFSALENVSLPLLLRHPSLARASAEAKATRALTRVGLAARMRHRPGQLSGGEQQRVAIARAIVSAPKLLVADEPTGNLDAATGRSVVELLRELQRIDGTTLVLATHDTELAAFCDRTIRMRDGAILPASH